MNTVMNLLVQYNAGNLLTEDVLAFQEGLCSMRLANWFNGYER